MSGEAPWLTLVGIGEDGLDGLSHAARRALAQAELVVGGRRHFGLVGATEAEILTWASPIEATFPAILARRGRPVCVLASGDPFCFGVGSTLARHLPVAEMRCYPQPSAFSLATARLGWAQQDCALLSCCGRPVEAIVRAFHPGARLLVLSADDATPIAVARLLNAHGCGPSRMILCEAMGGPRERLRETSADDFALGDIDPLNTIAIEVKAGPDARLPSLVPGRPDKSFETDGQITKREVRAVTMAKLAPRRGERLWDVGAGSGSVGIEWMLADPSNRAVAVERHTERAARIARNAGTFGVPGLDVVEGAAPAALAGLPPPDAVFIGGGATEPGIIDASMTALPAGGRLVINAVTIETQAVLAGLHARHGGSLVLLQIAEAAPVGTFHGFRPAMPVVQWAWVKP